MTITRADELQQTPYGLGALGGATHDVTNQPPHPAPYDASDDVALLEGMRREGMRLGGGGPAAAGTAGGQ